MAVPREGLAPRRSILIATWAVLAFLLLVQLLAMACPRGADRAEDGRGSSQPGREVGWVP